VSIVDGLTERDRDMIMDLFSRVEIARWVNAYLGRFWIQMDTIIEKLNGRVPDKDERLLFVKAPCDDKFFSKPGIGLINGDPCINRRKACDDVEGDTYCMPFNDLLT
jgi:hypothetical protein